MVNEAGATKRESATESYVLSVRYATLASLGAFAARALSAAIKLAKEHESELHMISTIAPCSRPSTPLRAACSGGLRPALTAAPCGAHRVIGSTTDRLVELAPSAVLVVK